MLKINDKWRNVYLGTWLDMGKILQEVRRPIALRCGKIHLRHAQVAQVSPMSPKSCALHEHRVVCVVL
jgi:hypothetical protein